MLRDYAAIAMQATIRGFLGRIHHRQELQRAKEENLKEIQRWSILILQKVARGFIARKTVVRSMRIRKELSQDVLRIAEKFMKNGDVWGFLEDINEELERAKKELKDTEAREDNWASKFVEKVVAHRQAEFNSAWDRFPAALQDVKKTNTAVGSLIDDHKDLSKSTGGQEHAKLTNFASTATATTTAATATVTASSTKKKASTAPSATTTTTKKTPAKKGTISEDEVAAAMNYTADTHYSHNPSRMPGPLLRKALQTTVKVEVASQLNKIMQTSFHSRKLAQDIIAVYGPESHVKPRTSAATTAATAHTAAAGVTGPVKKKKTTLDGKVAQQVGKVSANAQDWLSAQGQPHGSGSTGAGADGGDVNDDDGGGHGGGRGGGPARAHEVQPGTTLLLDVPLGLEDSVERLMHAAALRCYVPDFFRGATESLAQQQQEQWKAEQRRIRRRKRFDKEKKRLISGGWIEEANRLTLDDAQFDSDEEHDQDAGDGDDYDELDTTQAQEADFERQYHQRQRHRQRFMAQFPQAKNLDPNYAYRVYLSLPLGLAKIRYENECKKWAQPYINQLRIKGLHGLRDVLPVSKFMMCMVNVQTPRVLRNKTIDLCLDLKHMGSAAWGNHTAPSIPGGALSSSSLSSSSAVATGRGSSRDRSRSRSRSRSGSPAGHAPAADTASAAADGCAAPPARPNDGAGHQDDPEGGGLSETSRHVQFQDASQSQQPPSQPSSSSSSQPFRANLERMEDIDGTMAQLAERNAILAKQSAELAKETAAQSQAKALLQSILENPDADWCKLTAPIDDFFVQAAFLIVPHMHHHPTTEERPFDTRNPHIIKTVADMGNEAFKAYAMELYTLENEQDREDFVRARFRSAVILTTPFTLYLKNRAVLTVQDLLRVNLHDLQLPAALLYQLEVLITIVVGRQVRAKVLPTSTKAHASDVAKKPTASSSSSSSSTALVRTFSTSGTGADFAVPLFYDTRFQRTPLDPFGRPPILVPPRGKTTATTAASAAATKKKLRHQDAVKTAMSRSLVQFERVTSQAALEDDLHQASSLFAPGTATTAGGATAAAAAASSSSSAGDMDESDVSQVVVDQTSVTGDPRGLPTVAVSPSKAPPHGLTRSGLVPQSYLSLPGYVIPVDEDGSSVASSMAGLASSPKPLSGKSFLNSSQVLWRSSSVQQQEHDSLRGMSSTHSTDRETTTTTTTAETGPKDTTTIAGDTKTPSKGKASTTRVLPALTSVRGSHSAGPPRTQPPSHALRTTDSPKRPTKDYVELNRAVRPVDAFKETYRCHYPGCNQVFSRNYTYKVHLKTHEVFPQYHEYKNNPQLFLDSVL